MGVGRSSFILVNPAGAAFLSWAAGSAAPLEAVPLHRVDTDNLQIDIEVRTVVAIRNERGLAPPANASTGARAGKECLLDPELGHPDSCSSYTHA